MDEALHNTRERRQQNDTLFSPIWTRHCTTNAEAAASAVSVVQPYMDEALHNMQHLYYISANRIRNTPSSKKRIKKAR